MRFFGSGPLRSCKPLRGLLLGGLILGGCGNDASQAVVPNKTVPVLAFSYRGRSLADWRAVSSNATVEDRAASAFALAALAHDPAQCVTQLLALLRDPDVSVRFAAVVASERLALPSQQAASLIADCLGAPEAALRRQARIALGAMGAVALPALATSLSDERTLVRWGALVAATEASKGGVSAEVLYEQVKTLAHSDLEASVRLQALFTLPHLGPEGLDATLRVLRRGSVQRQHEAAAALAQLGGKAVPALAALLSADDDVLAALAAGVLADIGPLATSALPELLQALTHEGVLRSNAATALIEIGTPSIPALEPLLQHPDKDLAATARYILQQIHQR